MSTETKEENTLDSLFKDIPTELETLVSVPSRCKFYTDLELDSKVKIRPMNFGDEKALAAASENPGVDMGDLLLSRCLLNIDLQDLISMDKFWLLLQLRVISYGKDYAVNHTCPHCQFLNELNLDVSQLPLTEIPDDYEDPREIQLSRLGTTAEVRFPRDRESQYVKDPVTTMDNLFRFVVSLGGNKDRQFILAALNDERFPISDIHALFAGINGEPYGVGTTVQYQCNNEDCGQINNLELPLTEDFFSAK